MIIIYYFLSNISHLLCYFWFGEFLLITNDFFKKCKQHFYWSQWISLINPRTYTQIHALTVVQGGVGGWADVDGTLLEFSIFCSISKWFYLQWKAFDLLNKMTYILWVVSLLEACDVTNNGRHPNHHLGFHKELKIRLKPKEMVIFLCLTWKIIHKKSTLHDLSLKIYFCWWKKLKKNMYFPSKMAWPPAPYDLISRNHRNWLSLNLYKLKCAQGMNE